MSIDLYQQATDYANSVISDLTGDDLELSTPCAGWTVGRIVLHLADVADGLRRLVETGHLALPDPPRIDDPDPVSTLHAAMAELAAILSTTSEADHVEAAVGAGSIEFTTHGWDIGVARDPGHEIPKELANEVWKLASSVLTDDVRGSNFAGPVDVSADASPSDRLAGLLGRQRQRMPVRPTS